MLNQYCVQLTQPTDIKKLAGADQLLIDPNTEIKEGDLCLIKTLTGNELIRKITQINNKTYYLADDKTSEIYNVADLKHIHKVTKIVFSC